MNKSFFGKTLALSAVLASVAGAGWMLANPAPAEAKPVLEVYKSPSCGCCGEWVKHMPKEMMMPTCRTHRQAMF